MPDTKTRLPENNPAPAGGPLPAGAPRRRRASSREMAAFLRQAARTAATGRSPPQRLVALLEASLLGPTQREHLTAHAERVSRFAGWVAEALGLEVVERQRVVVGGRLHDLGKYFIPEAILAKPAPLTPAEWAVLSRHAADGAEMSLALGADATTAGFIRYHHTRYDGVGSPNGLAGEAIPLGARILAVADAFVTMRSRRPYRAARTRASALAELRRERWGQFDPRVVDVVSRLLRGEASAATGRRHGGYVGQRAAQSVQQPPAP